MSCDRPFESDSESVYGGPATDALLEMAAAEMLEARSVVEFGCGPGRFAGTGSERERERGRERGSEWGSRSSIM